jgi:hypothetical protein
MKSKNIKAKPKRPPMYDKVSSILLKLLVATILVLALRRTILA